MGFCGAAFHRCRNTSWRSRFQTLRFLGDRFRTDGTGALPQQTHTLARKLRVPFRSSQRLERTLPRTRNWAVLDPAARVGTELEKYLWNQLIPCRP
jgi:hypothetical protein